MNKFILLAALMFTAAFSSLKAQQTMTVSLTKTWHDSFSDTLSVPRFNVQNATLLSAVVDTSSSLTSAFYVTSYSPFPTRLVLNQTFTLSVVGYTAITRTAHIDTAIPTGASVFDPTIAGSEFGSFAVADLSTVSGPGSVLFPVTGAGTSSMRRTGNASSSWPISETVTVSITYTYIEN